MILSENIGYTVLFGISFFVVIVITILIRAEVKWLKVLHTVEWFSNAGGTIKTGLLASSVVSAWVWAATLLESSTVTYQFGIAGAFWYAAGATIPLLCFSIMASHVKKKIPDRFTFIQIIEKRFGASAHKVFLFFALLTNTIITSMLILGGAAAINALTGIDTIIVCILLPIGVIIYTFIGGLRATYLADYINVIVLFVGVLIFVSLVYFVSPQIGGISGMYEKLINSSLLKPVEGNALGSYITLASFGALIFGIINIVGNFGAVFIDQTYWQRAISAKQSSAGRGFIAGGLIWFAVPFTIASTLGLAAIGMSIDITQEEIAHGLIAPHSAYGLLGDFGAILILTMIFSAVTAAGSSQLIAASTLITHDIYKRYKNPEASSKKLFSIMRILIPTLGCGMIGLGIILFRLELSLNYVYYVMGAFIGSAVGPVSLMMIWDKTNRHAAVVGAISGLIAGIIVLVTSNMLFNTVSENVVLLFANIAAISIGFAITIFGSLIRPESFVWGIKSQQPKNEVKRIRNLAILISTILVIVWPLPLHLSGFVFNEFAFYLWITMSVIWTLAAGIIAICLPILESRSEVFLVVKGSIMPLTFGGIVFVAVFSYLFISSDIIKHEYVDYGIILSMIGFSGVIIILNKKLKNLVKIRTEELTYERDNLQKTVKEKTSTLLKHEKLAAIGELASILSHDLRNPLSIIRLNLSLLTNTAETQQQKECCEKMQRAVDRMMHQFEDVLDFVKMKPLDLSTTSIEHIIESALYRIHIPTSVFVKKDVEQCYLDCDKIKLESVFANLILNAVQAIDESGEISIKAITEEKAVRVEVSDSGNPISAEVLKRIFEPLFTTKQRGTGLGLVSCKKIIEQHKGSISVSTNPTVFTVIIPVSQAN